MGMRDFWDARPVAERLSASIILRFFANRTSSGWIGSADLLAASFPFPEVTLFRATGFVPSFVGCRRRRRCYLVGFFFLLLLFTEFFVLGGTASDTRTDSGRRMSALGRRERERERTE